LPKRGPIGAAEAHSLIAKLLQEENELDSELVMMMLDVFMRVCRTLQVTDATDGLSVTIARTVINIASEGECDADELYKRTLNKFYSDK
jgi:hypothetical protein